VPTRQVFRGKDEVRGFYRGLWEGIPDVKLELRNRIDADDCVVEQSEVQGTMSGTLFGFPPSGGPIRFTVVIFFPVRDGKFVGERVYFDAAEIARHVPGALELLGRA
jgi:predicted ester cyclase